MKKAWLLIGVILLFSASARAKEVAIQEVKLVGVGSPCPQLQVKIRGLFFPSMREVLMEGVPVALRCEVSIKRDRAVLWDSVLWKGTYTRVMKYNLLTKSFEIRDPPKIQESFSRFDSFCREAQTLTLPLPAPIPKSPGVYVEVKVFRKSGPLFFPLNLISFLLPSPPGDFETETARLKVPE